MKLGWQDIVDLARGVGFLGSGGGGDPATALLALQPLFAAGASVSLISIDSLPDDALVAPNGWIGAPTVSLEKLPSGTEAEQGLRQLEQLRRKRVDAVLPTEIGGSNGLAPIMLAIRCDLPVVDCDAMGRAFPESQMVTFHLAGLPATPAILTDANGSCVVIDTKDNVAHERIARAVSVAMGGICHMVEYPMSGKELRGAAIPGTFSAAITIGRAIRAAREKSEDPFAALFGALRASPHYGHAGTLFEGKIVDIVRETRDGFTIGRVLIEEFGGAAECTVEFRNENLVVRRGTATLAMVPDLVTIMDSETADVIFTERLRYGQRVKVVGASAPAVLRTAHALDVMGPQAFGLSDQWMPIEKLNGWV